MECNYMGWDGTYWNDMGWNCICSLAYCRPAHLHENAENIGAYLEGDREENSLYDLQVDVPKYCAVLCAKVRRVKGTPNCNTSCK